MQTDQLREAVATMVLNAAFDGAHVFEHDHDGDGWNQPFSDSYSCGCGAWGLDWVQTDPEQTGRPEPADALLAWFTHVTHDDFVIADLADSGDPVQVDLTDTTFVGTDEDAARFIASVSWPLERVENRDSWAPTMMHRPNLLDLETRRARARLEAAIAQLRAAAALRIFVPKTDKWWEPTEDPDRYRTVTVCDDDCHHPIHAFHPERRQHAEDTVWIRANAGPPPDEASR